MLKSLWLKFLLLLIIISAVALSSALVLREYMIHDFRKYLEGEMEDRIYWVSADLERTYEKYSRWKEDVVAEDATWALMMGLDVRIRDADGVVIMDSQRAVNSLSPLIKRRMDSILQEKMPEADTVFQPYPLFLAGKEIGSLEVRFLEPRKEAVFITRSNMLLLISVLIVGAISVLLSILFSRKLTNPVKSLAAAAESIIGGDLRKRVAASGSDEIGKLSRIFNKMAGKLEAQESLRRKLISNVAHELRTPLGAMRSEMEGMLDGIVPTDKEKIQSLYEEMGRLRHILDGIEDLAQAEASASMLDKQPFALKPFLSHIVERYRSIALEKDVSMELQCSNAIVNADPEKLSQVVINLLTNALKATGNGGRVWVKAGQMADGIFIKVGDTGTGISAEDQPFIFERFYKASEGGLGLGLSIVKELVEAHGGRVDVKSSSGEGSVFTVILPFGDVHNSS